MRRSIALVARVAGGTSSLDALPRGRRQRRHESDDEQQHADAEERDDARQSRQRAEIDEKELRHDDGEQRRAQHPQHAQASPRATTIAASAVSVHVSVSAACSGFDASSDDKPPRHVAPVVRGAEHDAVQRDEEPGAEPLIQRALRKRVEAPRPRRGRRHSASASVTSSGLASGTYGSGEGSPGESRLTAKNQTTRKPAIGVPAPTA